MRHGRNLLPDEAAGACREAAVAFLRTDHESPPFDPGFLPAAPPVYQRTEGCGGAEPPGVYLVRDIDRPSPGPLGSRHGEGRGQDSSLEPGPVRSTDRDRFLSTPRADLDDCRAARR